MNAHLNEFHQFEVDNSIINSLIHAQNGTIETAIRELVMNSIDAGASRCEIKIGKTKFSVADDGKGFPDRSSIERFFKRFGEPHKQGDALMGRFRIGRGQIMSLAKVTWHSHQFQMKTDIKQKGLGFELIEDAANTFSGCLVSGELYEEVDEYYLNVLKKELKNLLKYVECEVICNGVTVTESDDAPWDIEDEDLKVRWKSGRSADGIYLYSLGVFVKEVSYHNYGVSAEIVTKKALTLNMARNEINQNDSLWIKISNLLRERSLAEGRKKSKSNRLDEATRTALIRQFRSHQFPFSEVLDMPVFRDCRGQNVKLKTLLSNSRPVTISPSINNRIAEKVASSKLATVLHAEELRIWEVDSVNDLFDYLSMRAKKDEYKYKSDSENDPRMQSYYSREIRKISIVPLELVAVGISDEITILKSSELTPREQAGRNAIAYASKIMEGRLETTGSYHGLTRKIIVGKSTVSDGWTDGATFIAIGQHMLPLLDKGGFSGALQIALLLLHEYCHDESDIGSHEHNFHFYEKYHDLSSNYVNEIIGHTAESLYDRYLAELSNKNERLPDTALSRFRFPVVNDLKTFTGVIKRKGLSPLARMILDASKAPYKASKSKLTVTVNHNTSYEAPSRVKKHLEGLIRKSMPELPTIDQMRLMANSNQNAHEDFTITLTKFAKEWALNNGHDVDIVEKLFSAGHRSNFSFLLQLICMDKNSGLLCFEAPVIYPNRILGSATFTHNFRVSSFTGIGDRNLSCEQIAESKSSHTEFVLEAIKDIVNGITDKDVKRTFADMYFSENFKIQLDV